MKHLDYSISFLLMFFFNMIQGHGFQADTLVHCKKNSFAIERVSQAASNRKDSVITLNLSLRIEELEHEIRTAKSRSNCYFKIGFDLHSSHDIRCTPSQEFYLPLEEKWVPAFKLKQGNLLFSKTDGPIEIHRIDFFEQPLDVYSIEVKRNHNYFVGRYGVLTHNMFVPLVFNVGTAAVFSSGAAAGGVLSGCFGPIAVIGGAALGGIIGVVIKKIVRKNKVPTYDVWFDVHKINRQRSGTFDVKSVETDPKGAQALPKPTENGIKTVEDILIGAKPIPEKRFCRQFVKDGGYKQAVKDFDDLRPTNVRDMNGKSGKLGTLSDGRAINVREQSLDGRPTLEIQTIKNKDKAIKVRYGKK